MTDVLSQLRFGQHEGKHLPVQWGNLSLANITVGIARKVWINQGLQHASLVLSSNIIIHFSFQVGFLHQPQLDEREGRREEMRRECDGGGEIPVYKCRVQSFQV